MRRGSRRQAVVSAALLLLSCASGLFLVSCGDSDDGTTPAAPEPFGHVHGLGVNPADNALFIATHAGLFRLEEGSTLATRVGESRRDTMGFTVVSADTFLGSGHPDAREEAPPHLGLVGSADAGRTWRSLSLAGQADLHLIRVGKRLTYAFDALSGSLLVSGDEGSTWAVGRPPAPLIDLAVDPADDRHLVAATAKALFRSTDRGSDWRRIARVPAGLLAWRRTGARDLISVAEDGTVRKSADAGRSWQRTGEVGGAPTAMTTHEAALFVATADGSVKSSRDHGRTWSVRTKSPA